MQDLDPPKVPTATADASDPAPQNPMAPDGSRNRTGFGGWIVGIFVTLVVLAMLGVIGNVLGFWGRVPDPTAEFAHAGNRPLVQAAMAGDTAKIRSLQANGEDVDARGESGRTPLMWAVQRQDAAAVTTLLATGADATLGDNDGKTALHLAAALDSTTMLTTLLDAGVPVSLTNTVTGDTALADAAVAGHPDMVTLLLGRHVDVDAANKSGQTPLHLAAQANQFGVVLQLLQAGADPSRTDATGKTFQQYLPTPTATAGLPDTARSQLARIDDLLTSKGIPVRR